MLALLCLFLISHLDHIYTLLPIGPESVQQYVMFTSCPCRFRVHFFWQRGLFRSTHTATKHFGLTHQNKNGIYSPNSFQTFGEGLGGGFRFRGLE
jgi:hypothetical protein